MDRRLCIGLTGRMGAGKGEVVAILQRLGFEAISLSNIVREEASRQATNLTRDQMQDLGNRLRQEGGAGVLASRVREKILASEHSFWIIDGIRNPAEVSELKKLSRFFLLGVTAEVDLILKRLQNRGRDSDIKSENELRRDLEREWGTAEPADGQQVGACLDLCDFLIENNASLSELESKIKEILTKVGYSHD